MSKPLLSLCFFTLPLYYLRIKMGCPLVFKESPRRLNILLKQLIYLKYKYNSTNGSILPTFLQQYKEPYLV